MAAAVQHEPQKLRGLLRAHKVLTADGWGKGELDIGTADGPMEPIIVVGKLLNVRVGDTVEVIGEASTHPKFGLQFKVTSCTPVPPDTRQGVVLWMASRLPDVGATRARALVDAFGETLWSIIETAPMRLTEVTGITEARALAIAAAYAEVSGEREHMVLLRNWGLTDSQVAKCIGTWGSLATVVEHVRADPFELAMVVDGFGFLRADKVARKMGIALDAPGRIRAAILYMLDVSAVEGHCFMWGGRLRAMAASLLGVHEDLVVNQIFAVLEMQRCVRRGARVYTVKLDKAEAACAASIARMLERQAS